MTSEMKYRKTHKLNNLIGVRLSIRNLFYEDVLPGGKADDMSVEDLSKKLGIPLSELEREIELGIKEEMSDHTNSREVAKEIVMDHLIEDPKYYSNKEEY